jgi:hypothetical protein
MNQILYLNAQSMNQKLCANNQLTRIYTQMLPVTVTERSKASLARKPGS